MVLEVTICAQARYWRRSLRGITWSKQQQKCRSPERHRRGEKEHLESQLRISKPAPEHLAADYKLQKQDITSLIYVIY